MISGRLASWAVVLTTPADLGYDGSQYVLPELNIQYVEVPSDLPLAATLSERREARRKSLHSRCAAAARLVEKEPNAAMAYVVRSERRGR